MGVFGQHTGVECIPQEPSNMVVIGHAHRHYRPRRGKCPSGPYPPRARPNVQPDRLPAARGPADEFDTRTKATAVVVVPSAYLDTLNLTAEDVHSSMRKAVV